MLTGVFLAASVPVWLFCRLLFEEPGPILFGFFAGLIAVVLWVRRYEGEWTWYD
jgi:hypothetical protein